MGFILLSWMGAGETIFGQSRVVAFEPRPHDDEPSPLVAPRDPMAGEKKTQGIEAGVVVEAVYDDNIFLSRHSAEADFVTKVRPGIGYAKGDRDGREGGYLKVAYRPAGVAYARNRRESRIDHDAAVDVGVALDKAALDYSLLYRKLGDATADAGRASDRQALDHIIRVAWVPREKLALELAAGQSITEYAERLLLDSREVFGEIALRYAYSPKTRVGLAYRAGRFEIDEAPGQRFQRATAEVEWQPREKIRVEFEAGAEWRKAAGKSSATPVVEGRVSWQPTEKLGVYLSGYRRETASSFFAGQNYRATGVAAGVSQRIGDRWTAKLETGFERASYRDMTGEGGSAGRDELWFIRPSVEYRFTDDVGLEIFCRVSSNESSREGLGYDQNSAGMSLNYQF